MGRDLPLHMPRSPRCSTASGGAPRAARRDEEGLLTRAPRYRVGTSGYNYPEWKGSFYPEKWPQKKMLAYYAERLDTVEINYTFYRLPTERLLAGWSEATPPDFRFTLKAPRRITHEARLTDCAAVTRAFCDAASTLGEKLGALLFQLPPSFRKNVDVLARFLETLPPGLRVGVRVPARYLARSRDYRSPGRARGGALRGRQRAHAHAVACDRPPRVLPAPRSGVR